MNTNKLFWSGFTGLCLLGAYQSTLMLDTRTVDIDMQKYEETGDIDAVFYNQYGEEWKLVKLVFFVGCVLGLSQLLGFNFFYVCKIAELAENETSLELESETSLESSPEIKPVVSTKITLEKTPISEEKKQQINPVLLTESQQKIQQKIQHYQPKIDKLEEFNKLVLHEACVMFVGAKKGSGKTSRAAANVAEHIKAGHICKAILPIGSSHEYKGIPVYGRGNNYREKWNEIALCIREFIDLAYRRDSMNSCATYSYYSPFEEPHIHLFSDELSGFDSHIDPELIHELWDVNVRLLRQMNMSFSLGSHGYTKAFLGGNNGVGNRIETILEGSVQLMLEGVNDPSVPGGSKPGDWFTYIPYGVNPREKNNSEIKRMKFPENYYAPSGFYTSGDGNQHRYSDFTSLLLDKNNTENHGNTDEVIAV